MPFNIHSANVYSVSAESLAIKMDRIQGESKHFAEKRVFKWILRDVEFIRGRDIFWQLEREETGTGDGGRKGKGGRRSPEPGAAVQGEEAASPSAGQRQRREARLRTSAVALGRSPAKLRDLLHAIAEGAADMLGPEGCRMRALWGGPWSTVFC